jgi:hypothetical protein
MDRIDASRARILVFLERLHAERGPPLRCLGALDHPVLAKSAVRKNTIERPSH